MPRELGGVEHRVELAEVLVSDAMSSTAAALAGLASERGLPHVNERDHLQPAFSKALRAVVRASGTRAVVSPRLAVDWDEWPGVGNFDASLAFEGRVLVYVELKCGARADALGPCAWDAAKSALALARGAEGAFLLAGAPEGSWKRPVRGAEFFDGGEWTMLDLRERYADWWRHWERHGDPVPRRLPHCLETRPVASASFAVAGAPWRLRLSRLALADPRWIDWTPFLSRR
ncbi:MAG: hypothetical protein M3N16_03080 [Actinomycetota bacterium]|nr:hypothetical protein [Actinomycetota bacterium]